MRTGIILQARCKSKRFPNKIIKKIKNKYLIELIIERLKNIRNVPLIIATTNNKSDDKICKLSKKNKVAYFRGTLATVV